jgi:tetratricopeptide (TPR) repeat protein
MVGGFEGILPSTFPAPSAGWWCNFEEGLAMHSPLVSRSAEHGFPAVLDVVGTIYDASIQSESGLLDASSLAADLCRRGASALKGLIGEFALAFFSQRFYSPIAHHTVKVLDDESRATLLDTLDHAIEKRIVEGKQALLLSGGVDSSYIAATLAANENITSKKGKESSADRNIRLCTLMIEEDPQNGRVYHYLGNEYRLLGRLDKAIECYRRALELGNFKVGLFHSAYYLAMCYLLCEDFESAIAAGL